MRLLVFWLCVLVILTVSAVAEELLPKVQKELRARKFYFGEIDGRASTETAAAIKRFQLAKGIDATGHLDGETIRALGMPMPKDDPRVQEAPTLEACCGCIRDFWQAREGNAWERTAPFFADEVDYYFDRAVKLEFLRAKLEEENRRWPHRQYVMLNRVASLLPEGDAASAQVTVRLQTRVTSESGVERTATEDLIFRLRKVNNAWKITAVKLLE